MSSTVIVPVAPKYVIAKSANSSSDPMEEFLKFKEPAVGNNTTTSSAGRKRKLDHLSTEEKIQRKKLKNRVAAQTSRDRKKAKMEDMERTIQLQNEEIGELKETCHILRKERDELKTMYTKLERRFVEMERKINDQDKQLKEAKLDADIASRVIGSVTNTCNGSAASALNPLPQGLVAQSIARNVKANSKDKISAMIRIIALCVAWKSASNNSTVVSLKSLPTAYLQILQPKLKEMLQHNVQQLTTDVDPYIEPKWEPQPMENIWI